MSDFIGFKQDNVNFVQAFLNAMDIKISSPIFIETNNNEKDTLNLGDYTIIKDENSKYHLDGIVSTYSWEHGPEQIEEPLGEFLTLNQALIYLAKIECEGKAQCFIFNYSSNESSV